jgi:hypothetical protein
MCEAVLRLAQSKIAPVCDALRHHAGKLFTIRSAKAPARNTLSHANRNRAATMAEQLFWSVLEHLSSQCPSFGGRTYQGLPRRFKRMIHVVDATTMAALWAAWKNAANLRFA